MLQAIKNYISKIKEKNNKEIDYNKFTFNSMLVLVVLGAIAVLVIYIMTYFELKNLNIINLEKDAFIKINDEKEERGNIKDILSKKDFNADDKVTIKLKIPKDINIINPVVSTYTCNSTMRIYLDNKKIYSIGENFKYGDLVGTEIFKVDLGNDCAGKEITIKINVLDTKGLNYLYKIYLANSSDIDLYYVRKQVVNMYISNFLFVFGIICIFFNWFVFRKHSQSKRELLIAFTAIMGATWIISCEFLVTYYGLSAKYKYYMEYEALYGMVYFALKMFNIRMNDIRQKKYIKALEYTMLLYIIMVNIFRFLKMTYYQEMLDGLHLILLVSLIVYLVISIKNIKKYKDVFLIGITMLMGIGMYIVMHTFNIENIIEETDYAALAVFLLGIYMFISLINEIRQSFMDKLERQALLNKAYEDKLTSINNRRSCEKYMNKIDASKEKNVKICSFDINGLKAINDQYGHEKGDQLIKAFADVLKEVFKDKKNDFIGRMGGDEFIAIINCKNEDVYGSESLIIAQLEDRINQINSSKIYDFEISFASGMAICNKKKGDSAWDIYNFADKQMYDNKRRMKEKVL